MKLFPFKDRFRVPLQLGEKRHTARNHPLGEKGEVGRLPWDGWYARIVDRQRLPLRVIAEEYYATEGVSSPEEFRQVWVDLHPRRGWEPDKRVFLHELEVWSDPDPFTRRPDPQQRLTP